MLNALALQRGTFAIQNAGLLGAVRMDTDADADGFLRIDASLNFINLAGGVADTVSVGTAISNQTPAASTLESATFTAVNEAGATATGFAYGALGQFRVTNRGTLASGAVAAIRFAGDDTVIINEAGGLIRQDGLTPESALFGALPVENVTIFGANPAIYGSANPRIENSGTIIGTLRAIEVQGEAQIVNAGGGLIGITPPTGGTVLSANGNNFTVAIAIADGFVDNRVGARIDGGVRIGGRSFDATDPRNNGYILNSGTITNDNVLLNPKNNTNLIAFGQDFSLDGVVFQGAARLYGATLGSAHTGTISGGRYGVAAIGALTEDLINAGTISGGVDRSGPAVPGFVDSLAYQEAGVFIVDANGHAVVNSGTISGHDAAIIFSDRFLFLNYPDVPSDLAPQYGNGDFGTVRNLAGGQINGGILFERLVPIGDPDIPFAILYGEPDSTIGMKAGRIENAGIIRGVTGNALNGAAIKSLSGVDIVNAVGGSILSAGNTFDSEFREFGFISNIFVADFDLDNAGLIQAGGTAINRDTPATLNFENRQDLRPTIVPTATKAAINIRNAATGRLVGGADGVAATGNVAIGTAGVIRGNGGTGVGVIGDLSLSVTRLLVNPDPSASPSDPLPPSIFGSVTGVRTAALVARGDPDLNTPADDELIYGGTASITNDGVIVGQTGDGLDLAGRSVVTNTNLISGGANGIAARTLFVDNAAKQRDVIDLTIANGSGSIIGGDHGVLVQGGRIRLTNSGRIVGTAGNGIDSNNAVFTFSVAGPTPSTETEISSADIVNDSGGQIVGNIIGVNVARLADSGADADNIALINLGTISGGDVGIAVGDLNGSVIVNRASAMIAGLGAATTATGISIGAGSGTIINEAGATIRGSGNGDGTGGAIAYRASATAGNLAVTNAGLLDGDVYFSSGNDALALLSSGTISGASSGGDGVDSLRIDTTTGTTRTLAEGQFAAFEDIILNPTSGAAGRYVVTAATDPSTAATLDAGLVGSSITLAQGELSLRDTASSVRAETVSTAAGTLLSGNGIVFGDTSVAGTIAPGNSVGHLTVEGDLTLAPTALLTFELGQANVVGGQFNDLITVNGSLVLDGLLTVAQSAGGNFAPGVYRLIDYQGGLAALTDNGLGIGNVLPNGLNGTIQTSIANQVNLVIAGAAVDISYWDGANFSANGLIDGGTGVWNSSNTNFTLADGSANAPWDNDIGVFAGPAGGTVTVEGVQGFAGLQFVTDGYRIVRGTTDAGLTLGSGGFIFVDQAVDTRFDLAVTGSGTLVKQGEGRLILSDASSYAGGTSLNGGTLSVANDLALGVGGIRLTSGTTLQSNALGLRLNNDLTVLGSGSAVATVDTQTFDLTLAGQLAGDGRLAKTGSGALLVATGGRLAGVTVSGGSFDLVGAATLDLATSLTLADSTRLTLAQGTLLNAGTLGIVGDGGRQTIVSSGTINGPVALGGGADAIDLSGTISSGIDLGAGDDAFILRSNGSVGQSVNGGAGNDRLTFELAVGATRAIDGGAFTGFEDIEKGAGGTLRIATSVLTGQTLRVDPGSLEVASGAGVVLGGNASFGGITRLDIAAGASLAASSIIGDAAGQTIVNAGAIVGAVSLGDGSDSVDLSGRLTGTIDLGAGDDALILRASGTATAPAEGGSGTDALSINASTASDRAIGEGQFVNFETITLNADPGAQGRIVLAASSAALDRATLDAGVGSTSSVRLMQGELNLAEASASLRAPSIDVAASALLTGVGTVFTGMGNAQSGSLSVAGSISPGNAAGGIGTLHLFGAYRQTGSYVIDYRPPVDLNNIVGGALVGRNSYATPALAAGAQDADLLVINGAATLTGGSVLLRPQGSTAQFAAALTAPGNSRNEIRYQILHASGGLAGTRFVALSSANVALEYPNANDVDLVISGEVAPVLVVDGPPPTVTFNHVIGNALAQQLTASLPQSSFDCDVPIAGHGVPDRKLCLFGQISRNRVSLPIAGSGDASTTRYTPDALYTGFLRHVSTKLQLGFGIGHTGADQRGDGVQRSKVEGTALAFMTRLDVGRARLRATVGGGFYRATYNRESLFRDNRELTGAFDARFTNGTVEAELWFKAGKRLSFAPRIGGDWRVEWRDGFSEAGEALDRFSARAARIVRARATMGGIARLGFNLGSVPAFIEPSMFWTRELGDLTLPIEGIYAARPDIAVRTSAGNLPRNSFQANIGAAFQLSKQTTFRVQYENANRGGGHTESLSLRLSLAL